MGAFMELKLKKYIEQKDSWPTHGKHILAQFTDDTVVVYQAYRPEIGKFAANNGYFGGPFSYTRMSWIKPNFLWMMYRCGWATKGGQETVLAIHLKRDFFERILLSAFPSTNSLGLPKETWDEQIAATNVRLQWDPDHDPFGNKEERRAIQLGLRNEFLLPFKGDGIAKIEDITEFVTEQYRHVRDNKLQHLMMPEERAFPVSDDARIALGIGEYNDER